MSIKVVGFLTLCFLQCAWSAQESSEGRSKMGLMIPTFALVQALKQGQLVFFGPAGAVCCDGLDRASLQELRSIAKKREMVCAEIRYDLFMSRFAGLKLWTLIRNGRRGMLTIRLADSLLPLKDELVFSFEYLTVKEVENLFEWLEKWLQGENSVLIWCEEQGVPVDLRNRAGLITWYNQLVKQEEKLRRELKLCK